MPSPLAPIGIQTRGITNTNRLRRIDRWLVAQPQIRFQPSPVVVDLGFGASGITVFELYNRLRKIQPDVSVIGVEIDQSRVVKAQQQLERRPELAGAVRFLRGGFEVPTPSRPHIIRAANVLRQYQETEVPAAWEIACSRLETDGMLIDATCDEIGRVCSWIDLNAHAQPQHLTISLRLSELALPSVVAERLPKMLIHHNSAGNRVFDFLRALDDAWIRNASQGVFGSVQRWVSAVQDLRVNWPVRTPVSRVKIGEISIAWEAVAP